MPSFSKCYDKYFRWNDGLLKHFFSKGRNDIQLHVDKQLLEEIGQENGISADNYQMDFISSVEAFCASYNEFVCPNRPNAESRCPFSECKYHSNIYCLTKSKRKDVLAVANHICTKGMVYYEKYLQDSNTIRIRLSEDKRPLKHHLPFFAIVIYVILKFDDGNTQEWANVGPSISPVSRTFIPVLWEEICKYDARFDKDASVFDNANRDYGDYAGRILYHLPLSASTRNKIQDAIYKSSAWKLIDSKSFLELVALIERSLKDVRANEELKAILSQCFSLNDYKGISARRVQAVINDFDIDTYERRLEERKRCNDFEQTRISGEFALGIFFPDDNDPADSSIVLLTTVQQALNENGFLIREGGSGTFSGYNTSLVRYNNSQSVQLRGYSLRNNKYEIAPLPVDNIVFFFEYDDSLYIQTKELTPARSYIVAVREGNEDIFEQKCQAGLDVVSRWSRDDTRGLFGDDWTIYYTEEPVKGLGGILSARSDAAAQSDAPVIVMRGGIKNNNNCYFINALPYFEIPEKYDPQTVSIDFKLNGVPFDDYNKLYIGNRIILDLYNMPIYVWETGSIDIGLKCEDHKLSTFSIKISGQIIVKNDEYIYKFDRFGRITEDNTPFYFYGNHVRSDLKTDTVRGLFRINAREFRYFPEELYFTNLLAACCYNAERFEITHDKFRKCISYAATRLQFDIQRKDFISNAKALLSSTGILSINHSSGKCQVMPPSFMRVPFSRLQSEGTQLYMLNGCYTRLFIADLIDFCTEKHLTVYAIRNNIRKDEEKLLPPIILLDYKFNPESFCRQYGHQCDVLEDHDFALSLLSVIPSYREIESQFHFERNDSSTFLNSLESPKCGTLPRLRFLFGPGGTKIWYIEKSNNIFAEVRSGFLPWASILCHHERNAPMVIINKDHSVILPVTLFLPHYVQRALFMMNLGLPEERKVFVCGGEGSSYYSKMNKYNLYSADRCKLLASKMSGEKDMLVRNKIDVELTMEFWKRPHRQSDEKFLVLKDRDSVLAVANQFKVYLNDSNRLRRVVARSVNEAMSFIITEKWAFSKDHKSIGKFRNGGLEFDKHFELTEELLALPERTGYKVETIEIV